MDAIVGMIVIIWLLATIGALIQSLVCMLSSGRSGSTAQKIGGFLLAWFFGPFYWFFYGISDYCRIE